MKKEQHMDIQHLIIKSIYAALSAAERRQLEAWLRAPGHRAVYDRIIPAGGRERLMQPGQKADIVDGGVVVQPVDTAPYTAWNTGRLAFRRWPLRRIMAVVGKWYGKQVVFLSEQSEQKTFSGTFDRYDGIESTLEAIREGTGLQIETEKDRLVVY